MVKRTGTFWYLMHMSAPTLWDIRITVENVSSNCLAFIYSSVFIVISRPSSTIHVCPPWLYTAVNSIYLCFGCACAARYTVVCACVHSTAAQL